MEAGAVINGELIDHALWRPGAPDGYGDLHRTRVIARAPTLGGAFVTLDGAPDGFLPDREADPLPRAGDLLGIRVSRSALGGKGPRVTARLDAADASASASGGARLIRRGPTPLDELLDAHPALPIATAEPSLAALVTPRPALIQAGDPEVAAMFAGLRELTLDLPGGARASIHPTPALVAIDVDTGREDDGKRAKQMAQFAANRLLLPRLLHELRLRNLSGAILIDLAGLAARKRARLAPEIETALARDPLRPRLLGFTALGLAEIVRRRRRPALHELGAGVGACALDAAEALWRAASATRRGRFALRLDPALVHAIEQDQVLTADLARDTGYRLILRADPSLGGGRWIVEEDR